MTKKLPMSEEQTSAAGFLPQVRNLEALRDAAKSCQGCDLYKRAAQTVIGEGSEQAEIMFVGEQPGDKEALAGRPFVGPAGRLLDKALEVAGIDRNMAYVINAVKHFKWKPRGKKRIHKKPSLREISACPPWLDAEIDGLRPKVIVCLGATVAQAMMGKNFKVSERGGQLLTHPNGRVVMSTIHPSSILRAADDESRHREMDAFVKDMKKLASFLRHVRAA